VTLRARGTGEGRHVTVTHARIPVLNADAAVRTRGRAALPCRTCNERTVRQRLYVSKNTVSSCFCLCEPVPRSNIYFDVLVLLVCVLRLKRCYSRIFKN